MRPVVRTLAVLIVSMTIATPAIACLWDYDTLMMERNRFPGTIELITGKFLRHSQEFYQWRIEDRLKKLADDPQNLNYHDDLAVAYEKTGQHRKAIETILAKDKLKPGLYETHANLGTFYIHDGQLEKGLEHIERAIEINPDAHFGREIYQKHLVNYVLLMRQDENAKLSPDETKSDIETEAFVDFSGFAEYLLREQNIDDKAAGEIDAELKRAIKGVLGMMRFGNYDSPVLLAALGDLLVMHRFGRGLDAKRLAARAYLKASYESKDDAKRKAYRELARESLQMQTVGRYSNEELSLESLEKTLSAELADADLWFEAVRADELNWIEAGKNVDEEFSRKYYQNPELSSPLAAELPLSLDTRDWILIGCFAIAFLLGCITIVGLSVAGIVWIRRKRNA